MPDAIGPLSRAMGLGPLSPLRQRPGSQVDGAKPGGVGRPSFGDDLSTSLKGGLGDIISQVNDVQHEAASAIDALAGGEGDNLHEVMLAVNKAELSFSFLMEARNKLVDAYQEVMRMSV